jgi:CheY-like chemotaxis protein
VDKQKILVVVEDIKFLNLLQSFLKNANYKVLPALNKFEGITKAWSENPDMVIVDLVIGDYYEGLEMVIEMKNNKELKNIPVVLLTSQEIIITKELNIHITAGIIRSNYKNGQPRVLIVKNIVTGKVGVDYITTKSKWFDVEDVLKKPVTFRNLFDVIRKTLSKRHEIIYG